MPTVPRYVQTERPRGYQNVQPSKGGQIMANAWQQAGKALQGAGDTMNSMALDMQRRQNEAVAQEAMTAYEDLRHTYTTGVVENKKGKNALGDANTPSVYDDAVKWHADMTAKLLEGKTDAQKKLLEPYLTKRGQNMAEWAHGYYRQQWDIYETGEAKAFQTAQLRRAVDDPAQMQAAMANYATSVLTYNRARGVSDEATNLQVQEGWDKAGTAVVRQFLAGDDLKSASRTLDQYEKDLSPSTVRELRAEIKKHQEALQAKADAKAEEALQAETYAQAAEWAATALASDDPAAVDKKRAEIMQEPDAKKRRAQLQNFNFWVSVNHAINEATYGKQAVDAVMAVAPEYRAGAVAAALEKVPARYRSAAEAQLNTELRRAEGKRQAELQETVNLMLRVQQANGWTENQTALEVMNNPKMSAAEKSAVLDQLKKQREGETNRAASADGLAKIRELKDQHPEWSWDELAPYTWQFNMNAADIDTARKYEGKAAKVTQSEFAAAYKKSSGREVKGSRLSTLYDAFLREMPDGKTISTDDMKRWCDKAAFSSKSDFFTVSTTRGEALEKGKPFVLSRDYYTEKMGEDMRQLYASKGLAKAEEAHVDLYNNLANGIPTAGFMSLADLYDADRKTIEAAVKAWKEERDAD